MEVNYSALQDFENYDLMSLPILYGVFTLDYLLMGEYKKYSPILKQHY